MARGLEVLRAAIEDGRRVWLRGGDNTGWIRWEPSTWRWLDSDANEAVINWRVFWSNDWEVEPAPSPTEGLTFAEAVAAMDRGEVVEHSYRRFRIRGEGYAMWCEHVDGNAGWEKYTFDYDDIHATDWKVVQTYAAPARDRPTFREFTDWMWKWGGTWKALYAAMEVAQTRWPGMFRQEDGHGSGISGSKIGD